VDKKTKRNITLRFVAVGLIPVLLLTAYFVFFSEPETTAGTPNTPNVLKSEKDSAVSMTARNSWYLTMLLRKVELAGRMASEIAEGVFKRQNAFFTQDDYKKIKADATGKFYWNPEKAAANLFVCGGYKAFSKDKDLRLPVIGAYLDNTLLLAKKNVMPKEDPNGAALSSIYIMTDTAIRKFPWVPAVENLVRTGMFTAGNYKIRPDSLFINDETSPYSLAGPKFNKGRLEIWTEPYWSKETGSWTITYLIPVYLDETYKGVLGMDLSVQKLLEMLIGKDQAKKFTYEDAFPVLISKNGLLVASTIYGYDKLKLNSENTAEAELKNYGSENFKNSLARILNPKFWDNSTAEEGLGGIETLSIGKEEYYCAHFPLRTGGLTFGLFIPAANLEKSAAVSVTTMKSREKNINVFALRAGLIGAVLSIIIMVLLAGHVAKKDQLSGGPKKTPAGKEETPSSKLALELEKEFLETKLSELGARNEELSALLEKSNAELKTVQSKAKGQVEVGFSKYIYAKEANERFDAEKKALMEKINKLEEEKQEVERRFNDKSGEYRDLILQNQKAPAVDPGKYIPVEEFRARVELETGKFTSKLSEAEKVKAELENRLKEAQQEKTRLNDKLNELIKTGARGRPEEQHLVQRLDEAQRINEGFVAGFEKLKKENTDLTQKIRSLEAEGRNLANTLVDKFEEEKRNYIQRIEELNKQVNIGSARVVELENKIKTDSVKLAQMDPAKFTPLSEVNTRIEIEKKNYILKIQELENKLKGAQGSPADTERFILKEKVQEQLEQLEQQNAQQRQELEARNKELVLHQKNLERKINEAAEARREQSDLVLKLQEFGKRLGEVAGLKEQLNLKENELLVLSEEAEKQKVLFAEVEEKNNKLTQDKERAFRQRISELEAGLKAAEQKPVDQKEYMPVAKVAELVAERLEEQDQKHAARIRDLEARLEKAAGLKEQLSRKENEFLALQENNEKQKVLLAKTEENSAKLVQEKEVIYKQRIAELEAGLKAAEQKPVDQKEYMPVSKVAGLVAERLEEQEQKHAARVRDLETRLKAAETAPKVDLSMYVSADRFGRLEKALQTLNNDKEVLTRQLAAEAASKESAQKIINAAADSAKRLEEEKARVKELEQKSERLLSENKRIQEALALVEGRKKETDRQAQSLIQKVGEEQQQVKAKIKELEGEVNKLKTERDAALKQYEVLRKELETAGNGPVKKPAAAVMEPKKAEPKEEAKPKASSLSVFTALPPEAPKTSPEHSETEENNILIVDDQGEIIKIFGDTFYNMGYSVYIARNTKLARQKLLLGNYRNVVVNVNLADGDYKELFEAIKKGDPKFAEKIIFFNSDENKDQEFLAGKKIMRSSILEKDIKILMA